MKLSLLGCWIVCLVGCATHGDEVEEIDDVGSQDDALATFDSLPAVDEIDGLRVVEGDILVSPEEEAEASLPTLAAAKGAAKLWPKGIVPYVIDAKLPKTERVTGAIAHWESLTGLRFVKRTNQAAYIRFIKGAVACFSHLGRKGTRQDISLTDNCSQRNVIHEIGHAVGFNHEQNRSDRDGYIRVHTENIDPKFVYAFNKTTFKSIGAYDYNSVMHYGSYFFSKNKRPSMTLKDGRIIKSNSTGLSPKDVAGFAELYASENLPPPRGQ